MAIQWSNSLNQGNLRLPLSDNREIYKSITEVDLSFPPRPETDDECRLELLRLMGVAGFHNVYVLGCFAKYVTVYAQQVRALNLVDTLAKAGILSNLSRVAVVGGGIAGLTAAAAAAVRGVAEVQIFEKLANSMRLQRSSEKRYIHPFIYDWPEIPDVDQGNEVWAKLPLMDWKADRASDVIAQLDRKWKEVVDVTDGRLREPRFDCGDVEVGSDAAGPYVRVKGEESLSFDVLIIAVGFGLDLNQYNDGYWADTRIDSQEIEKSQSWFVSGYGDGALTDLMRLCIRDFRHGSVLREVDEQTRTIVGKQLLDAERAQNTPEELVASYVAAAELIAPLLHEKLPTRKFGKIWLNCSRTKLFSPQSSVLNRLICAYLLSQKRFELFDGKIVTPITKVGSQYKVRFENSPDEYLDVDEIIVRHGPDKVLKAKPKNAPASCYNAIWNACQPVAQEWSSALKHEDWTRTRLFSDSDFDLNGEGIPPLRVRFGDRVGCVLVTGTYLPTGANQAQRVGYALNKFAARLGVDRFGGKSISPEPVWIRAEDAFASSATYERTVRALCEAEIAVFDITGLEASVMLFLGIRAAVRRGITITLKKEGDSTLPFNLASLNPIEIGGNDAVEIADAMEAGLNSLTAQPNSYLDLPVFDAVRQLGDDFRPKEPAKQILVLRWFEPRYDLPAGYVVANELKNSFGQTTNIVTTLDSRSPQLVEQRLYGDIRRTNVCIADWTGWRPNVFFEIGVRLAVNKIDPVFILCDKPPPEWKSKQPKVKEVNWPERSPASSVALEAFFAPTIFSIQEPGPLRDRIDSTKRNVSARHTNAKLSPGRTYQVVLDAINPFNEPGGRQTHDLLEAEARAIAGIAVPEGGELPVLYSEILDVQVRNAAIEFMLAAWFYLAGRYRLIEKIQTGRLTDTDTTLVQALRRVGEDIQDRLRNPPAEYELVYNEIMGVLEDIEQKGVAT